MSSINPNNINGQYPVAGQDNDSQGFRDNFTNIKNNFTFAKGEIEDIQSKVIVTSALDGFALDNDLNNTLLKGAQLIRTTETIKDLGPSGSDLTVNWTEGHFQLFELTDNVDLTLSNWPESGYMAKLRLMINVTNVASYDTVYLVNILTWVGLDNVLGGSSFDNSITFTENGRYIYEFSRYGTSDIFVEEVLMERIDPPPVQFLPQLTAANVGLSLTDSGKHYYSNTTTPKTLTITSNANVPFPVGTQISIVNKSTGNISIDRAQYPANVATNVIVTANSITSNVLSISTVSGTTGLVAGMAANVAFADSTVITLVDAANSLVYMSTTNTAPIANTVISFGNLSTVSLYLSGNSTNSDRVVTGYGTATLLKVETNTWFVSGTGVV